MRVLCVIDSLSSGGAQRQLVTLACGLKAKGHDVELLVFFPNFAYFRPEVERAGVPIIELSKGRGFSIKVILQLTALLRRKNYNAVVSFLTMPNVFCEIASIFAPRLKLVVSERVAHLGDSSVFSGLSGLACRLLHFLADGVVANAESHATWLRGYSWLRHKTHCIYNGYLIGQTSPNEMSIDVSTPKYLVVSRVHWTKNGLRLIEALLIYFKKHGKSPSISWAGRRETDSASCNDIKAMENLLEKHPAIAANWHWLGERNDVPSLLEAHEALIHPSLIEGLPNAVCEALISGRPILASNICDHPLLVENGIRGFLFDPLSPESICNAIERFESLTSEQRAEMGKKARQYAEEKLSQSTMIDAYEVLLTKSKD